MRRDLRALKRRAKTLAGRLAKIHGTPDLGNVSDPVRELIYISLTRQTHQINAQRSWTDLWSRFPTPEEVRDADPLELEAVLRPAGFSRQKAGWIKGSLVRISQCMGELSLEALAGAPDEEVVEFLTTLPGISIKSALCIMMYSMNREVLPVDTHLRRIAERTALVQPGLTELRIHQRLQEVVPPKERFALHVNSVAHGRAVCTALRPRCSDCVLYDVCKHGCGS